MIRSTQCSEEGKLGIHAGEAEVKRLLGDSKEAKEEAHRYLNAYDVPDIVMNLCCVVHTYAHDRNFSFIHSAKIF